MKKIISLVLALVLCMVTAVANADFTFGEPINLGPTINSSVPEYSPCISADGLSLYFASYHGAYGLADIYLSTRETTEDDWDQPVNLGPIVNSSAGEYYPSISNDELELYFERYYPGSLWGGVISRFEIWVTKRTTRSDPWAQPVKLDLTVTNEELFGAPSLSADGLELYFTASPLEPRTSLYVMKRETKDDPWGEPVSLGPTVNSWSNQTMYRISSDGLLLVFCDLFFTSPRPGGFGDVDMWLTRRVTKEGDWEEPVNLGPLVNTSFRDWHGMVSTDGSTLYFSSTRPGGLGYYDLWQAPIIPIVDLNSDGVVDGEDLRIIGDNWGTDNSLCDIGPMPWGDGIVDVQDLIVIAEYLQPAAPEDLNVDDQDDGGQVELKVGQILVVTLESNPTTGYSWEQAEDQDTILEQQGQPDFISSQTGGPPIVGAGGWEVFRFKAVKLGKMILKLIYRRPWEEGVEPVNTFTLDVTIH
jgi:predicted secreted protein/Tol biopolymer transport system component